MNSALLRLRKRFTFTCVILSGVILIILFGAIFASARLADYNRIDKILESALISENISMHPEDNKGPSRCMIVSVIGTSVAYEGFEQYSDTETIDKIVEKAMEVENGYFRVGLYSFAVKTNERNYDTLYAIYDRTMEKASSTSQAWIFITVYGLSLLLITFLGWKLSEKSVKPVEDAFEKQKELIANASHELKTPLTVINTNLNVIESDPTKTVAENEKWFENINSLVTRMDSLILEMLELSRLDDFSQKVVLENINLSEIINGAALSFDVSCFEKKITIETDIQENVIIKSNAKMLEKLGTILFENAFKYTDEGGKIILTLSTNGKKAIATIRNTGKGISKENLSRVFDRFYKQDQSRNQDNNPRSFGLGLSIAKAIVENLNGTLTCDSVEDEYTEFIMSFPLI